MDSITVCLTFICFLLAGFVDAQYYPAPSLTAYPSQVIYRGGSLTFLCYSDVPRLTLSLCRDCNTYPQIIESKIPDTDVAEFNIKNLKYEHGGDYCCFVRAQSSSSPYSNILRIEVTDSEDDTFIAKDLRRPRDRIPRYVRPVSMATPRSNRSSPPLPLTLLECRQEDSGTEEEVPDIQDDPVPGDVAEPPLSPAGAEEEVARVEYGEDDKFIAKDYLIPVIAAVCSILLLIFVGVIVFYIVRKSNRAKEKLHCSQIPLEDKVPHAKEPTYCSVDENISREKPDVPMERQEEDVKDADVVTYAVLNKEALNKNRKSLDTKLEDSSFYAEVRK
ncbi:uncharacterized protein LOC128638648 isoform X5 [Bombina bombina]|uniref:uncharacterized protein LOC128638648 isoform X5 n=1 Tax=Bombina bombina TaxID=8345 RepID=UPI00235B2FD6|nr:uncharacterized protein LOC128638648 isoform X5 [Bombina bombina]